MLKAWIGAGVILGILFLYGVVVTTPAPRVEIPAVAPVTPKVTPFPNRTGGPVGGWTP